jgi:3'-5' exoribonuclease
MKVKDLIPVLQHPDPDTDARFTGQFGLEIVKTSFAQNGELYGAANMYDFTGSVRVYAFAEHWGGKLPQPPTESFLAIQFEFDRHFNMVPVALPMKSETMPARSSLELLPAHHAPRPDDLPRLVALGEGLSCEAYRDFLACVFSDPDFARAFLTLPAGHRCHHTEPGGLLRHSLEVAEGIQGLKLQMHPLKRDAGILLGLFHDVGKLLLSQDQARKLPCRFSDHEDLIEVVLDNSLSMLRCLDPDAYWALWQVVHAYQTKSHYEAPLAKMVAALDGVSAQQDAETRGRGRSSACSYWVPAGRRYDGRVRWHWSPPHGGNVIAP